MYRLERSCPSWEYCCKCVVRSRSGYFFTVDDDQMKTQIKNGRGHTTQDIEKIINISCISITKHLKTIRESLTRFPASKFKWKIIYAFKFAIIRSKATIRPILKKNNRSRRKKIVYNDVKWKVALGKWTASLYSK